tara:strand:- start:298 stop:828 length:531 start_codon:yes stop_codon:yes gene_type:complete
MYWEETIELIKKYGEEPKSTYPHPYSESDDYEVYLYERGTFKTKYIPIEDFPENIKDNVKKYLKYDLTDFQLFSSLGASEGFGVHGDPDDVLIICLEGEISYIVEKYHGFTTQEDEYIKNDPVILKPGDTIFIQKGLKHMGISSTVPRICLSCGGARNVPKEEVTHYFGSGYRTKI